ncbi:Lrp/AsnC ligand binding domain-containing protein [Ornithinimicrobium avium]|uniref:Lrp/AsnC family transcriptional regulator n=1 Tax=Ornithinimicrobium avium TaxID=2283195 RepID=A0A345NIJ4_9MICO|nr:Lrp/AsnC ligand binding domain-containing protein [Ornithinimicrobium avium]AXH94852.1 Lrp/AsnC family transcriptional regulator [Ornithinimicrobium avium]
MIKAYILVQTEVGASADVTRAVRQLPGVLSAEDVAGPYDVIVVVESPTVQALGREVIARVQAVPRITRTTTCTVVEF